MLSTIRVFSQYFWWGSYCDSTLVSELLLSHYGFNQLFDLMACKVNDIVKDDLIFIILNYDSTRSIMIVGHRKGKKCFYGAAF